MIPAQLNFCFFRLIFIYYIERCFNIEHQGKKIYINTQTFASIDELFIDMPARPRTDING